jgi:hypothetical protein
MRVSDASEQEVWTISHCEEPPSHAKMGSRDDNTADSPMGVTRCVLLFSRPRSPCWS